MPDVELDSLRSVLADASAIALDPFGAAKAVANACSQLDYDSQSQDLVLRSLDKLQAFGSAKIIINALVRECGLFPYLNFDESSTSDLFAAALHKYPRLDDGLVLHRQQREVLAVLLERKSVVLSAPTSFGKSALIDAVLATDLYSNVLILVPTIALMDETRRRLSKRFSAHWKVITHPGQERASKNISYLLPSGPI